MHGGPGPVQLQELLRLGPCSLGDLKVLQGAHQGGGQLQLATVLLVEERPDLRVRSHNLDMSLGGDLLASEIIQAFHRMFELFPRIAPFSL